VRHHRLRSRADQAGAGAAAVAAPGPSSLPSSTPAKEERVEVLRELADALEDIEPCRRVAGLRHLAEHAADLFVLLETIERSAWALDRLSDVASALGGLELHRRTLEQLSELDYLADDVERLACDLRDARRCQEEVEWAIDEFEQAQQ